VDQLARIPQTPTSEVAREPEVRHLLLCDDVRTDPDNYHRIHVLELITTIRSTAAPPFPVVRPLLCALVILTGGQGTGELRLRIFQDRTGRISFRSRPRPVRFVGAPEAVLGAVFRIRDCSFREAGLYVEAVFAGSVIARQKLWLTT
jgi:hypothetical protein